MANIPGIGGYVTPSTYSRVKTLRRSVSIPGGIRILSIIGVGEKQETVVLSAQGSGLDGVNPDFTGAGVPDGRHFVAGSTNLIEGRTSVFIDGIPLRVKEEIISINAFDSKFDARVDPLTGRVELQRAHLVDQGGITALPNTSNVGNGTVTVSLLDPNAPSETWTLRATGVIRDSFGDPVPGTATFSCSGSVSGQLKDQSGTPVVFVSNGAVRDNGVLQITIDEGSTPFDRGDRFKILVDSKVLKKGQSLEVRYIAEADLNDPEFFVDANALYAKHGLPSTENTLSLGAAMAFENGAFGVLALQAKPPLPRKTSEVVVEADNPLSAETEGYPAVGSPVTSADIDAFKFTINKVPDLDAAVNFFVIDRVSGVETQVFPTKVPFYDATISADPFMNFINSPDYSYSYTVILDDEVEDEGSDGYVSSGDGYFQADSASFSATNLDVGETDVGKYIRILPVDRYGNDVSALSGEFEILSVGGGINDPTTVELDTIFPASAANLKWELVDKADQSARILITKDLATSGTIRVRDGLRVSYISQEDAGFFDTNWAEALDKLEAESCQIVVPLPNASYSAIQQATVAHCEAMSTSLNKKERVAIIGAVNGVTAQAIMGNEQVAVEDIGVLEGIQGDDIEEVLGGNIEDLANYSVVDNFGNTFRAIYMFPDQIIRNVNGTSTILHGFYMAAAVGGWLSGQTDYTEPLTGKSLVGFTIPRSRTYKPVILNGLGNAGACTVTPITGGGRVVHGKTTVSSGAPEEEEITIVFIRDRVASVLRQVLLSFVGKAEDPTLGASILSSTVSALLALQGSGLITDYKNLSVSRDQVDPRQWNVTVECQPNYPVNWVFIDVSIGLLS